MVNTLERGGTFNYYQFYKGCEKCHLLISVNPLSNSVVTLIVNFNSSELPSLSEHYEFKKVMRGTGYLDINPEKVKGNSSVGIFTIAVHSYYGVTYSLIATATTAGLMPVQPGIEQPFSLNRN